MNRQQFLRWNTEEGDKLTDGSYSVYLKGREDMFKEIIEAIEIKMKSYTQIVDGKEVIKEDIPNDDSNWDKYVVLMNLKEELTTLVGGDAK